MLCTVSFILAFAIEISEFLVDLFGGGAGDWDPIRKGKVSSRSSIWYGDLTLLPQVNGTAIAISIVCFYLLDFALNVSEKPFKCECDP